MAQPVYVSLAIGRNNAVPGDWNATIHITCAQCPTEGMSVAVNLHVFNVTLPTLQDTRLGSAWSGSWDDNTFAPYYPDLNFSDTKHKWFDLMIDSRMPPDSIYLTKARDYDDYKYMGSKGIKWFAILDISSLPLTKPGSIATQQQQQQQQHGSPAVVPHAGGLTGSCANYTDEYVHRMIETLRPIVEKLTTDGLLSSAYIYGFDENPVSCEPQVRKLFGATKKEFPALKTAAVLNWSPMPVDLPVDIWILQYEEFNPEDVKAWVEAGKRKFSDCVCVCSLVVFLSQ